MKALVLLLLITTVSCKDNLSELAASFGVDESTVIIQKLQGTYKGCHPSAHAGYYLSFDSYISGKNYSLKYFLTADSTCVSGALSITEFIFEIDQASYAISGNTEDINVDLKMKNLRTTFIHPGYLPMNYCGLTDWAVGVPKELAGVPCFGLYSDYDVHNSSFRAVGDSEFQTMKIKASSLVVSMGYTQSGDSPSERVLANHELSKL